MFIDLNNLRQLTKSIWNRNCSLMIGAGFSRNANLYPDGVHKPPLWNDLKIKFIEELYLDSSQREKINKNVLQIAQEYECFYGRLKLDDFLYENIKYKNYFPGKLHEKMLELPWNDVFTTNYDDLLEKTRVNEKEYSIIRQIEDIPLKKRPRIIKLHGSFPSPPYIITEEDYRTYPRKFAPFVNLVQQSLLEDCLCLIGFSGTDPNFLSWTGWIRDNLGKNHQPIFMVGNLNLSSTERKMLESRLIRPIDLYNLNCDKREHKYYLNLFTKYINVHQPKNIWEWPYQNTYNKGKEYEYISKIFGEKNEDCSQNIEIDPFCEINKENIIKAIKFFKNSHITCPDWFIFPDDIRKTFLIRYAGLIDRIIKNKKIFEKGFLFEKEDFNLVYEIVWISEKLFIPFFDTNKKLLEDLLLKYNPFKNLDLSSINNTEVEKSENCCDKVDREKWMNVFFHLMKLLRYDFEIEKLLKYLKISETVISSNEIWKQKRYYELSKIYHLLKNEKELIRILNEWKEVENPLWLIRKAVFYFELNEKNMCNNLIMRTHTLLNKQRSHDLKSLTEFSWIKYIINRIENKIDPVIYNLYPSFIDESHYYYSPNKEIHAYYTNIVKSIYNNIDNEHNRFDTYSSKYCHYKSFTFLEDPYTNCLSYFLLIDDLNIPFNANNYVLLLEDQYVEVLKHVFFNHPYFAMLNLKGIDGTYYLDEFFDKEYLLNLDEGKIEYLYKIYFNLLIYNLKKHPDGKFKSFKSSILLLSRLSYIIDSEGKKEFFSVLLDLIINKNIFSNDQNLFKEVVPRMISLFKSSELLEFFNKIKMFPCEYDIYFGIYSEFIDKTKKHLSADSIDMEFNNLLSQINKDDKMNIEIIKRVYVLYKNNLVSENNYNVLIEFIANNESIVKKLIADNEFELASFLVEDKENLFKIIKEIILKEKYPEYTNEDKVYMPKPLVLLDRATVLAGLNWEKRDIDCIIEGLYEWWKNAIKIVSENIEKEKGLPKLLGANQEEIFKSIVSYIKEIFSYIILPNIDISNHDTVNKIYDILNDIKIMKEEIFSLETFFNKYLNEKIEEDIIQKIYSDDTTVLEEFLKFVKNLVFVKNIEYIESSKILINFLGVLEYLNNAKENYVLKCIYLCLNLYNEFTEDFLELTLKAMNNILEKTNIKEINYLEKGYKSANDAVNSRILANEIIMKIYEKYPEGSNIDSRIIEWKEKAKNDYIPEIRIMWSEIE